MTISRSSKTIVTEHTEVTWIMSADDAILLENLIVVAHDHVYGYPRNTPQRLVRYLSGALKASNSSLADLVKTLNVHDIRSRVNHQTLVAKPDEPVLSSTR